MSGLFRPPQLQVGTTPSSFTDYVKNNMMTNIQSLQRQPQASPGQQGTLGAQRYVAPATMPMRNRGTLAGGSAAVPYFAATLGGAR